MILFLRIICWNDRAKPATTQRMTLKILEERRTRKLCYLNFNDKSKNTRGSFPHESIFLVARNFVSIFRGQSIAKLRNVLCVILVLLFCIRQFFNSGLKYSATFVSVKSTREKKWTCEWRAVNGRQKCTGALTGVSEKVHFVRFMCNDNLLQRGRNFRGDSRDCSHADLILARR